MQVNHNLTLSDLDMLIYIYNEGWFTRKDFELFEKTMAWDLRRFKRLRDRGYIDKHMYRNDTKTTRFRISNKGNKIVNWIYDHCEMKRHISTNYQENRMYLKGADYSAKRVRPLIEKYNKELKNSKFTQQARQNLGLSPLKGRHEQ